MEFDSKNVLIGVVGALLAFTVLVGGILIGATGASERSTRRVIACIESAGPDLILCIKEAE